MKINAKRWIALAITILLVVVSAFVPNETKEEDMENKYLDQIMNSASLNKEVIKGTNKDQKIKVVSVEGTIMSGEINDFIVKELEDSIEDESVKGVILKVNSPGGSVYASEQIANEVKKLKEAGKPIYTVMQELAASGGYYISAPTDKIYASNETRTGSIGVIIQSYSFEGLFNKYGIKEQNVTSGAMKDAGSAGHNMRDDEKDYFQGLVDSAYKRFVKLVAEGRNMSEGDVEKIADGRVYDGSQAIKLGLVDEIGDLDKAIEDMTNEYSLKDPLVFKNKFDASLFSSIFSKIEGIKKESRSDLAILDDLMKTDGLKPMYLFGGYDD